MRGSRDAGGVVRWCGCFVPEQSYVARRMHQQTTVAMRGQREAATTEESAFTSCVPPTTAPPVSQGPFGDLSYVRLCCVVLCLQSLSDVDVKIWNAKVATFRYIGHRYI